MSEDEDLESPCGSGGGGSDLPAEVHKDLLCPICLELFRHPVILPCSHVLCRSPCAHNLFDFNFIRCPVCRENCYVSGGLGSLPRVIPLESIIDKYRSERRRLLHNARRAQKKAGHHHHPHPHPHPHPSCAHKSQSGDGHAHEACPPLSDHAQSAQNGAASVNSLLPEGSCQSGEASASWRQRRCGLSSETWADSSRSGSDSVPLSPASSSRTIVPDDHHHHHHHRRPPSFFDLASTPRTLDRFDASLFDVSTDSVTSCSRHGSEASVYCQVCERCVCDVCGDVDHVTTHVTNSLEEAAGQARDKLSHNLEKLTESQRKVLTSLEHQRQHIKDMEQALHRRTEEVNMQCDSLLAEVEHKRSLFLADLEQEERMRRGQVDDVTEVLEKVLASSQSLAQYTKEVMDKDAASVLQVTPALNEQLLGSVLDCEACQGHPDNLHPDLLHGKVVDLRKEQALLRDIHYLNPPALPSIDLVRCARSDSTVALFLSPARHSDVIDSFVIRYCSEDQKALGIEETLTLDTNTTSLSEDVPEWNCHDPHDPLHPPHGGPPSSLAVPQVVLLEHLRSGTAYLFCASAANRAGTSASSQVVQCVTLTASLSVVPVPVILEALCHTYPTSVRVYTPSPRDVAPAQGISHFLLHRPRDRRRTWRCLALGGRVEQKVHGLEPHVQYEFVVMATNARGECQVSDRVVLETDSSAA